MVFTLVKGAGCAKPGTEPLGQGAAAWTDGPQNTLGTIRAIRNMVSRLQKKLTARPDATHEGQRLALDYPAIGLLSSVSLLWGRRR